MSERRRLEPGPGHPITVQPYDGRVTVQAGETTIADTKRAIELQEAGCPVRFYIPLDDVDRSALRESDRHTYCPYKGEASYYDIELDDGSPLAGAVWYYPEPYDAVADIAGTVCFYADHVTITTQS